jgi:hypothetical protein
MIFIRYNKSYLQKLPLLLIILICSNLNAQKIKNENHTQLVDVPDSIRIEIACFELNKSKLETDRDSSYAAMYVRNLLYPQDTLFKDGIYTYQILGPHFQQRIFIFSQGKIYIFKNNFINDVVEEFSLFLEDSVAPVTIRIEYLNAIAKFLKQEYTDMH